MAAQAGGPGWLLAWAVLLPLAGSALLAVMGRRLPGQAVSWVATCSVAAAFLAVAAALAAYTGTAFTASPGELSVRLVSFWPTGAGGARADGVALGLLGDGLSLWFALVVTGVGLLIHVYSVGYMAGDPGFTRYFAQLNYFVFAMLLLVLSDGLVGMLVGWAGVGLASYLLIGFWHHRPDARAASMKAFIVTQLGELGIVLAAAILWARTGTVTFQALFERLAGVPPELRTAAGLLLLWGAAAKSAQLPLHVWLPDAMAGPTPVSALIHSATMVTAGVYLTARMHPLYQAAPAAASAVAWVGAASALFGAVVACGQTDVKRVLAYSTMSQIGYMFLAVGLLAHVAGLFHFFTQAFFKALLFLAAGLVIHHLAGEQDLTRMGGLGRRLPLAYGAFAAGVLSMAGLPPFAGYFSKEAVLEAAWGRGEPVLWAAGALAAGLTGFYSLRMLALAFTGRPRTPGAAGAARRHGPEPAWLQRSMAAPVVVLALLALAGGWVEVPGRTHLAGRLLGPVFERFRAAGPGSGLAGEAAHAPGWVAWGPVVLAAAGGLVALYLYGPARGTAASRVAASGGVARAWAAGFYVDELYRRTVVAGAVRLSGWMERVVEQAGIDATVHGVGSLVALLGGLLGRVQGGHVRRYALAVVAAAAAMGAWAVLGVP